MSASGWLCQSHSVCSSSQFAAQAKFRRLLKVSTADYAASLRTINTIVRIWLGVGRNDLAAVAALVRRGYE